MGVEGLFEAVAARASFPADVARNPGGRAGRVGGELVSGSYFETLGVRIARGRGFQAEELDPDVVPEVAVVSDDFWRGFLGGGPDAVGTTIILNGHDFRVIGVTSADSPGPAG